MKKRYAWVAVVGFFLWSLSGVLASETLVLQGNLYHLNGTPVSSGDLVATIYDSPSGGTLVWNSSDDLVGVIQGGQYDVLLGNNTGTNPLTLQYGAFYYLELWANNEQFFFDGETRQMFQSSAGQINTSLVNDTASGVPSWMGRTLEDLLSEIHTNLFGANALFYNATQTYNRTEIDAIVIGNATTGLVVGSVYLYNDTSILHLNETKLNQTIEDLSNITDANISVGSVTATGNVTTDGWINGLFNWSVSPVSRMYVAFNGEELSFNDTQLNATIDDRISQSGSTSLWENTTTGVQLKEGQGPNVNISGNLTLLDDSLKIYKDSNGDIVVRI